MWSVCTMCWLAASGCSDDGGGAPSSLRVNPPAATLGIGDQITVAAFFVIDGSSQSIDDGVTWTTDDGAQVSVTPGSGGSAVVRGLATGSALVTATARGLRGSTEITVAAATLTAITISPPAPAVAAGLTVQLAASGSFSDGSQADVSATVTWMSATAAVATIDGDGTVTGVTAGTSVITASQNGVTAMVTVTVGAPLLTAIAVTPTNPTVGIGMTQPMTATGTYSAGPTMDLTTQVAWTTGSGAVATVTGGGLITGVAQGSTAVIATLSAISGQTTVLVPPASLVSIVVGPDPASIADGRSQQFTATGMFSDASTMPMTEQVTWSSTMTGVATVSTTPGTRGLAAAQAAGTTMITATSGVISDTAMLTVTAAELDAITVTPSLPTLAKGRSQQFTATGLMSDGATPDLTSAAVWDSSDRTAVPLTAGGLATAAQLGSSLISAAIGTVSGGTTMTVGAAVVETIVVTPANPGRTIGQMVPFTATGTFSDASVGDVTTLATWGSSTMAVATVTTAGVASALTNGTSTISATIGPAIGATLLSVGPAPTVTVTNPADAAVAVPTPGTVAVTFSVAMRPLSLTAQSTAGACSGTFQLSTDAFLTCLPVAGPPVMSAGDTVATFTPAPALAFGITYRVRVTTGALSALGVAMAAPFTHPTGFTTFVDEPCGVGLVISQVYGGGGNAGSVYTHDFIELHNTGPAPVALDGMALQYASAAATSTWDVEALPSVIVPAGGYYLIQDAMGGGGTTALPTPDLILLTPFDLSVSSGKLALTSTTTQLPISTCPLGVDVIGLVGWGGSASCFEGAAAATAPSNNTTSLQRRRAGCIDAHHNGTDFARLTTLPRSGGTAPSVCACVASESNRAAEADYCVLQFPPTIAVASSAAMPAIYTRIFETGVTTTAGASPSVRAQIGHGPRAANPQVESGWSWFDAAFNVQVGNDDEYQAVLATPAIGAYAYAARVSIDGSNWTYCDLDGAGSNGSFAWSPVNGGALTVSP